MKCVPTIFSVFILLFIIGECDDISCEHQRTMLFLAFKIFSLPVLTRPGTRNTRPDPSRGQKPVGPCLLRINIFLNLEKSANAMLFSTPLIFMCQLCSRNKNYQTSFPFIKIRTGPFFIRPILSNITYFP